MRTEPPSPWSSALARLRRAAGLARRWLAGRGLATRLALLLAALAPFGAAGYLASVDVRGAREPAWLFEGRKLPADDVSAIADALERDGIARVVDRAGGRVGVDPDRKVDALAALAKRKVAPRTLPGRSDEAPSPWEGPDDRERRELARIERGLEYQIEGLDPSISSAHVEILRSKARGGLNPSWNVGAYVYLRTEGNRRLGHRAVQGIETFLRGNVPDLKPENITVADGSGWNYLSAGNPSLNREVQRHAQEEDWRDKIVEDLRHIPDVDVAVILETAAATPPPAPKPAVREVARPNGPLVVEPEAPPTPVEPPSRTLARVWVRVPRSFYHREFLSKWPTRQPTRDDLEPLRATTEKFVRDSVEIRVPRDLLGEVKIDTVQDDLAAVQPLVIPEPSESSRSWQTPTIVGAVVASSLALVLTLVRLATRRPTARPPKPASRPGFVADGPAGPIPGPSERVRELIRSNPEAAAGVLQRWIGQGGSLG